MVIKINENNQELYNRFFEEAYKDAVDLKISVPTGQSAFKSLWEYYNYLPQLAALKPVYYTKLPLDEPMMEINGDSREIKIPTQLIKCAGIENDHYAESIMFLIDRYHDGQDLTNSQIWIQWKAEDGTEDYDNVPTKDTDFSQNQIRFPWPLTSKVTSHPGIIEFSVVFFAKDSNQEIVYRYSTLTSKIRIEPALSKADLINATDVGAGFAAAVRANSYGPGFYQPIRPYFSSTQGGLDLDLSSDLDYTEDTKFGALFLRAQATVTDTGSVSYQWKYKVPNGTIEFNCGEEQQKTFAAGTQINEAEQKFIEAYATPNSLTASNFDSQTKTFKTLTTVEYSFGEVSLIPQEIDVKNINKFDRYYSSQDDAIASAEDKYLTKDELESLPANSKVYERISKFDLPTGDESKDQPVTGLYYVIAKNQIKYVDNGVTKTKDSLETISTQTTLTSPEEVSFSNTTQEVVEFTEGDSIKLDTKLQRVEGENYVAAIAKVTSSSGDLPSDFRTIKISDDEPKNADSQNIDSNGTIEIFKESSTDKTFSSGIGWYQAEISSKRNRETKKGITKIWRVVNPVAVPKLTHDITEFGSLISEITESENGLFTVEIANATNSYPSVTLAVKFETEGDVAAHYKDATFGSSLYSDGYTVNWQKITSDKTTSIDCTELEYTVPENDWILGTRYKCTIVNTLNGKTASGDITFELR